MMRVDAALRFRFEHTVVGVDPRPHPVHVERAAAVGHIDALGAIAFHQQGLARECLGLDHMAHHQEARDVHAEVARDADMLLRYVGFGAMRRDAHRSDAEGKGAAEFLDRAYAGQDQCREHRLRQHRCNRLEPFPVGVRAEAIVEARARKPVAMCDLDRVNPGFVERLRDRLHMVDAVHVADRVHPVAQRDVLNIELVARIDVEALGVWSGHAVTFFPSRIRCASSSPVALAAAVMMSRLPE